MNKLINFIDNLLNRITMYRLMLYYLTALYSISIVLSFLKILPYNFFDLLTSGLYIILITYLSNQLFSKLVKVRPNYESQLITGLILALIVGPIGLFKNIIFLTLVTLVAMGSKYLLAYKKQHIFNPAALAVVITAVFLGGQGASWWIGSIAMAPFILLGGLLMLYKLKRFSMVLSFLLSYLFFLIAFNLNSIDLITLPSFIFNTAISPVILFFTFVMLTEPITSPANKNHRMYFGVFTGFIYVIYLTFFSSIFYSLELSLISANLIFRLLSFSNKYILEVIAKKEIAPGIWEFIFKPTTKLSYIPGQYMEWSVPHKNTDSRGNRRYFTIASSPTEENVDLSVRVPEKASSYKKALIKLMPGDKIYATNLEGEFVLQKNTNTEYVFIAGGIGITPFRSIIKYMLDNNLKRQVTIFYMARSEKEFVYKEILNKAEQKLGAKIIYVIGENPPSGWTGEVGRLNMEIIKKYIKEINIPFYYISGPQPMVSAYKSMLKDSGIKSSYMKSDYFPGYDES